MKSILVIFLLAILPLTQFAQDKKLEFELKNKYTPIDFIEGEDCFYMVCEERVMKNLLSKVVFKFDKDLNVAWKEPIVMKSSLMKGELLGMSVDVFPYLNAADNKAIEYITKEKGIFQVLPDASLREIVANMPAKEAKNKISSLFLDANGLNILTIVGDETFPTGSMNWYTFAHSDLSQSKRTISLPLPSKTDKDNESGWRLNEVTDSGLYFYYVSYKNKVKDESRPILSCHVIHVDRDGKAGNIIDIDLGLQKYTAMPDNFQQSYYSNLRVVEPYLYEIGGGGGRTITTDNAMMGVKIDGNSKRIYSVIAQNKEVSVANDGRVKGKGLLGANPPVESLLFGIYDFDGKKIAQNVLRYVPPKFGPLGEIGSNGIDIIPLPENEGVICRYLELGYGSIWSMDGKGEIVQELKTKPYDYKENTTKYHYDVFTSSYYSMKDFQASPYVSKEASAIYQAFQKLEAKSKKDAFYLSLKNYEILAVWDSKENKVKFNSFTKKQNQ